jgi:hypothetical protein
VRRSPRSTRPRATRRASLDHHSSEYDEVLDELIEAVTHHVEEEESSVLPGMRENLSADRLAELGEAFMATRAEHMGDKPGEASKEELVQQARNAGISGVTSLGKDEITERLRDSDD